MEVSHLSTQRVVYSVHSSFVCNGPKLETMKESSHQLGNGFECNTCMQRTIKSWCHVWESPHLYAEWKEVTQKTSGICNG